jgi:hypothetical protein
MYHEYKPQTIRKMQQTPKHYHIHKRRTYSRYPLSSSGAANFSMTPRMYSYTVNVTAYPPVHVSNLQTHQTRSARKIGTAASDSHTCPGATLITLGVIPL